MTLADVFRVINAGTCLALIPVTMYALTLSVSLDQRIRMLVLAGYGAVTGGSNLGAFGDVFRWQLPALAALSATALISTLIFVRREWRARNDAAR